MAADCDEDFRDPEVRAATKTKIFLSYTSNLISSGLREHIRCGGGRYKQHPGRGA